jgi:hypothetical protein
MNLTYQAHENNKNPQDIKLQTFCKYRIRLVLCSGHSVCIVVYINDRFIIRNSLGRRLGGQRLCLCIIEICKKSLRRSLWDKRVIC